ncbi:hypothetical protein M0R88_09095 [Halorussus gelatinilyticus]|uniref:DNA recombination and repair protein Rad51-like C-terminal domain-containing protein n=1 Tax=Halorussus gelatinilyticus TaxID=2937524 RepID=A0A8U0IQ61_9EURY|nr:hypothetical protein [Halorussus gelatinilyticus]UPW02234.1 hypothetical protein M0R88_09095 [Halorussus gelatinilyticus]
MHPRGQNGGRADPELPELETGVRLLDVDGDERATGPLHSLVLDHLLMNDGNAVWVDAAGHAVSQSLASLAPSGRTLDRIRVARGFTAYQHYSLVRRLPEQVDEDTSLVVCPAFDHFYRDTETYADEGDELFLRALATVASVADEYDVPVLVTRSKQDSFSDPLAAAATETIRCEQTKFGPRFVGDEFETLVYPMEDGTVQTTLSFWRCVLEARVSAAETTTTPEVAHGAY